LRVIEQLLIIRAAIATARSGKLGLEIDLAGDTGT